MAGIKEILEVERARESVADWQLINLFQEGSFYRAYEASAWLCCQHIGQFKVTHRHVKGIDQPIAFVGFPVSSLEKRTPDSATVARVGEKHVTIALGARDETKDISELKNDFEVWKSRQPITESKEGTFATGNENKGNARSGNTLFSVAQKILAFPVESNSPIDCMLFLAEVKKDLSKIL